MINKVVNMDEKEVLQIAEEIENNEELGTEENEMSEEELEALDVEEEEFEDDFEEELEREVIQVTETIQVVSQPVVTIVSVGAEVGSKGEVKPVCKVTVERHIEGKGDEINVYDIIADDFDQLSSMVKVKILGLKKSTNPVNKVGMN